MVAVFLWYIFLAYAAILVTTTLKNAGRIGKITQKLYGTIFFGLDLQLAFKRY